jgi:hypothetical protein
MCKHVRKQRVNHCPILEEPLPYWVSAPINPPRILG